jgi:hypothetical protein
VAATAGSGGGETTCGAGSWVGSATGGSGFIVPVRAVGSAAGGDTAVFVDPRRWRIVYNRLSPSQSSPFPYRHPPPIQRKIEPSSVSIPGAGDIHLCAAPAYL